MSTDHDSSVDYYAVLGLSSTATLDEIKNAHVTLALKYHPDLSTVNDGGKRFRDISEAWAVLGKSEKRQMYDLARMRVLGSKAAYATGGTGGSEIDLSEGFKTQKTNFDQAVKSQASSNWKEMQEKYKTEAWQKMPLSEKKLSRVRSIQTVGGTVMPIVLTLAFVGFCGYTYYTTSFSSSRRRAGVVSR